MEKKDDEPLSLDLASTPKDECAEKQASNGGRNHFLVSPELSHLHHMLILAKRIFHYADSFSWALNCLALITAIGSGATLPLMTIVFGSSIAQVSNFGDGGSSSRAFQDKINNLVFVVSCEESGPGSQEMQTMVRLPILG